MELSVPTAKPIAEIGLFRPINPLDLRHKDGVMFAAESGVEKIEKTNVLHGFLEGSNVSPISEITRMIEVQRAYEMGQKFNDKEDKRILSPNKPLRSRTNATRRITHHLIPC